MNTETTPIGIMDAKTQVNAAMQSIRDRMKNIENDLRYTPSMQDCATAWLRTCDMKRDIEELAAAIDQLAATVRK